MKVTALQINQYDRGYDGYDYSSKQVDITISDEPIGEIITIDRGRYKLSDLKKAIDMLSPE